MDFLFQKKLQSCLTIRLVIILGNFEIFVFAVQSISYNSHSQLASCSWVFYVLLHFCASDYTHELERKIFWKKMVRLNLETRWSCDHFRETLNQAKFHSCKKETWMKLFIRSFWTLCLCFFPLTICRHFSPFLLNATSHFKLRRGRRNKLKDVRKKTLPV